MSPKHSIYETGIVVLLGDTTVYFPHRNKAFQQKHLSTEPRHFLLESE